MTTRFTIDINAPSLPPAELDFFLNDPQGEVGQSLRRIAIRIVVAAKVQVGKDTGELAKSIEFVHERIGLFQQVRIGSDNEIALIHHEGTRPHAIVARNAQALRFSSNGRIVYARFVNHPGTKPNNYLSDNLRLAYV